MSARAPAPAADPAAAGRGGLAGRLSRWLFEEAPLARVALLRLVVYAFVVVDVLHLHADGRHHGAADPVWYTPLVVGEVLHLPAATVLLAEGLRWGSALLALAAMSGRAPRLLGWATAVCWSWFQYVSFSYGKVDHDRADFLVALFLLPTAGLAHLSDARRSQAAGFALRAVQLMAIATYFLSAVAKVRFGGWEWVNSATIARAVVRRGAEWVQWTLEVPWTLHALQWVLFTAELTAPVIFLLSERWRRRAVGAWFAFHAATYAGIGIAFWPHLVMMLAFLPLEQYRDRLLERWRRRRGRSRAPAAPG
ncbi:HTTM domain-containing protein [Quadrisphaera sp. DSM 44207]|uniref:HTTM domain-containing protein n=1 Tax=Quadrisphaera sp. DSM 44207 TaxID=1881057 RepID=UPI00088C6529|nr:HTTM domain-containing protein [Quadrisphaera sp. DSM 44207]SDQ48551.1 Vitamin K-dependent gamma-carboxylase [Quadrisphaera sp. DSM 44207]